MMTDELDPIRAAVGATDPVVLAVISKVVGPFYRPVGTMMCVLAKDKWVGNLSSGCVEADIALHAQRALQGGQPMLVRYGQGSPFIDIKLPCGGGMEILLLPNPDQRALDWVLEANQRRQNCTLAINPNGGEMAVSDDSHKGRSGGREERDERDERDESGGRGDWINIHFRPPLQFIVFGSGPEASTFSTLVRALNHACCVASPDHKTLSAAAAMGAETQHLTSPAFPAHMSVDARTAIVLFFHDHDWEPPILAKALQTPAFYVGAQGSVKARDGRISALETLGVPTHQLCKMRGPIGLIPSARNPKTLAISVLAEIESLAG